MSTKQQKLKKLNNRNFKKWKNKNTKNKKSILIFSFQVILNLEIWW